MDINRNNYEAYFLDFAEGNLSAEQEEILHRFLRFNPDLAEELQSFSLISLAQENTIYPGKSSLKKEFPDLSSNITDINFDFYCIAYLEGDLTDEQADAFTKYLLVNSVSSAAFELYKSTFLKREEIVFPRKSSLKRRASRFGVWRYMAPLAVAATIALFIFLRVLNTSAPMEYATIEDPDKKPEEIIQRIEEKKAPDATLPASINVIRTKTGPVPASDFKKLKKEPGAMEKDPEPINMKPEQVVRIADLKIEPASNFTLPLSNDQIQARVIKSPEINPGSLSLYELARYQFKRASDVIDEEDVLLWNLASNGIKEINKLAGSDAQLLASRDDQGAISGIQFRSRFLNVTTPISRSNE